MCKVSCLWKHRITFTTNITTHSCMSIKYVNSFEISIQKGTNSYRTIVLNNTELPTLSKCNAAQTALNESV